MRFDLMHPREQIALIMERIYGYGMTTTSGGNLSILDEDGNVWISPGGTDKGRLRPEDIVCLDMNGNRLSGHHKPSVEYPFHLAMYRKRPDIRGVLHAHPPALVSFSIARQIPDTRIIPKARDVCGDVAFAPYGIPGTEDLGAKIAEKIEKGFNAVILESHGVLTVGDSLFSAFQRFETLDFCARLILKASLLGTPKPLVDEQWKMMNRGRNKLSEFIPDHHSSRELELRKQMCEMIHRAYDQMLITSTEGTFSARVDAESFLITPVGMDRKYLDVGDLILIRNGMREAGKLPSRSVQQHMKMYQTHPDTNAIIIAHPTNVMAFGVSGTRFDSRTIPESYIVLRDIPVIPYGPQFTDMEEFCGKFNAKTPLLMVENDCLITTGKTLLEAYDRLEVAEFSAKAVIAARAIGSAQPITDEQVADLCATFKLPM